MINKRGIVEKADAERAILEREKKKEVINRINHLMESAGLVRASKDGKRKFYQASFESTFGINKATVSAYYQLEREIPIETLLKISKHEKTKCSLDYLLLKSDAVNYEFDAIIKKTGLSEAAINKLIEMREYDEMRTREYQRRKEFAKTAPSDVVTDYMVGTEPIPVASIVSSIIESEQFRYICDMVERQIESSKENLDSYIKTDLTKEQIQEIENKRLRDDDHFMFSLTRRVSNLLLELIESKSKE